jgi:excisionase family DNA binding protein
MSATRLIEIPETLDRIKVRRTKLYELIKEGKLRPVKIGSRTLFVDSEIEDYVIAQIAARDSLLHRAD